MRHPIRIRPNLRQGAIALALCIGAAAPSVAAAQAMIAPTSTPTADALARHMRALAADAGDLRALIGAGEASAKLGDGAAAMQFFARAEKIDPRNSRIAAGRGRALVTMERPGEALKYFAEAERLGLSPAEYAGDRGLAYDLMGYPANAQADYRLALSRGADDEITRRLALSLGISGKREEAARLLDTMLRANDRQAWRVQAMVVAMDGDFAMADRIAASMMPGFGPNLAPFFRRLPALSPGDRAFAGHFGQLQRTPQRMADASMAPPVGAMPAPPTMLADAGNARRAVETPTETRTTRTTRARERTQLADNRSTRRSPRNQQSAVRAAVVTDSRAPVQVAAAQRPVQTPAPPARQSNAALSQLASIASAGPSSVTAPPGAMVQAVPSASAPGVTLAASSDDGPVGARLSTDSRGVLSLTRPIERALETRPSTAATTIPAAGTPQPAFGTAASSATVTAPATASAPATVTAPATARTTGESDDVIGRIMRGISVPGSELGVAPMPGAAPVVGAAEPIAATPEPASEPAPVERAETPPPAKVVEKPAPKPAAKPAPKPTAKKPVAPADPARHWVQVAGGARTADLYKDWDRLAKQSPAAFKGKQGWTTPLRATNRLLAGPFKTPAEAQIFVNAIAKDGISAFAWESEAGQKIETLKR